MGFQLIHGCQLRTVAEFFVMSRIRTEAVFLLAQPAFYRSGGVGLCFLKKIAPQYGYEYPESVFCVKPERTWRCENCRLRTARIRSPGFSLVFYLNSTFLMFTSTMLRPYIAIARFDHWFKNVFMLPGFVVAYYAHPELLGLSVVWRVVLALLAAGFVASSNYVINELLDAPYDALHPVKKNRPIPSGLVQSRLALLEWIGFAVVGLLLSSLLGWRFFSVAFVLWIMGCVYNVPPVRSKDKPYVDVLSESINNPLRLLMGWYATGIVNFPPLSLLIAYWMVGAFFMAVKRFAEYRRIGDPAVSATYRRSFQHYTEARLMVSIIYYAVCFGLFFGIFLMRYKMEMILSTPLIAGFIAWYIHLGLLENSPTQYPELLYRQKGFTIYCVLCAIVMQVLLFSRFPWLYRIFESTVSSMQY